MPGILIVDDMPVIRSALARILSQHSLPFSPVMEATNGEEAVALARSHKPDVILMDIKMPLLTGLQATAIIRREQPEVKIVMLTAYNEFSYVQKALQLGARDYVLKPVRPEKLLDLLAEIDQEIQEERRDLRTVEFVKDSLQKTMPVIETNVVENLIRGLSTEGSTQEESLAYLGKRIAWPLVLVIKIDNFEQFSQDVKPEALGRAHAALDQLVRSSVPEPQHALISSNTPGRAIVIVSTAETLATSMQVRQWAEELRETIAAQMPFTVTIGLGKRHMGLETVPLSYAEANLARRFHGGSPGNQVATLDDLTVKESDAADTSHYLVQRERELAKTVQIGQVDTERQITEIVDYLSQRYYSRPEAMQTHCTELVTLVAWATISAGADEPTVLNVLHEQVRALAAWKTIPQIRAWTLNSLSEILILMQGMAQRLDPVQNAMVYIQDNYQRSDLSLKEVAEAVSLSQSHFSTQFKMRTGTSYVKYLTSVRLDAVKKLLLTSDCSVATASERVGYPNVTNLYRHFRRDTGMTPAQYREANGR